MISCLFLLVSSALLGCAQVVQIKVGMLIPSGTSLDDDVGFYTSAGAMVASLKMNHELGVYDPSVINITFAWYFDQCSESLAAGYAAQLIKRDGVNAIFGPACPESLREGRRSAGWLREHPVVSLGAPMPKDFSSNGTQTYKTTLPAAGTVLGTVVALSNVLNAFNWTQIAFLYTANKDPDQHVPVCPYLSETIESGSTYLSNVTGLYTRQITNTTVDAFQSALRSFKTRARIIVVCLENALPKRNLMLAAIKAEMVSKDYVFLFVQGSTSMLRFGDPPFWEGNDGQDAVLKEAFKRVLTLDKYSNDTGDALSIRTEVADYIHGWPFYCNNCSYNVNASAFAVSLGDAFTVYLNMLNQSYTRHGTAHLTNGTQLISYYKQNIVDFTSLYGTRFTLSKGARAARYSLSGLSADGIPMAWATVGSSATDPQNAFVPTYDEPFTTVWETRGGFQPPSVPLCGFNGEKCQGSPLMYALIGVGGVILFLVVLIGLCLSVYIFQRQQRRRLNALWQVDHALLRKPNDTDYAKSVRSMQSGVSTSTKASIIRKNTERTEFLLLSNEIVVARKHPIAANWTAQEEDEFRKMRQLDRANLNKQAAHWGMIRDIVEALFYIHNSSFVQHGTLSAYRCVVGDRFEVKVQFYGLSKLKEQTMRRLDDHSALYVAPEHLQGQQNQLGSQAGDIYSFAIVCSVILTMKPAYDIENVAETEAEIVRNVARGRYPPTRPSLESDRAIDVSPELISLIKRCWAEHPTERPKIEECREILLKRIFTNRSTNVMDYMFALMENTASDLELQVQQQTLELIGEQKKADILLYRMMPKAAADALKVGQSVNPELYTEATVFFSDIVGFTILASKSSPLQIINFLNDVYTLADNVIDSHDAYKAGNTRILSFIRFFQVETIGDGMHVVSGVPKRNGNEHVKAIADLSIDFQRAVKTLRMPHIPDHPILMRVGVHSGSVVAGIVGMTAPRYCVFGDTVNLAAKMEASGRAGRIHITLHTKALLQQHYAGKYTTFSRGEVLIKGIGAMITHWLVGPEDVNGFEP
ncbi:Guanylate cyclase [Aphelenchoides fujianensis]|nr:Guanylate cyclase [Aphelenchoides fujianensis]